MPTMKEPRSQRHSLLLPCTDSLQGDSDTVLSLGHKDNLLQPHPRRAMGKAGESGLQGSLRADTHPQQSCGARGGVNPSLHGC